MPYIKDYQRAYYDKYIRALAGKVQPRDRRAESDVGKVVEGEINYIVYKLMLSMLNRVEKKYSSYQKIIGAVLLAVDEFKRRHLHPYEDEMIEKNGDIK